MSPNKQADEECNCEFDPYGGEDHDEESFHFKRTCESCGYVWWGLHCPHDGYQNPCPGCLVYPKVRGAK